MNENTPWKKSEIAFAIAITAVALSLASVYLFWIYTAIFNQFVPWYGKAIMLIFLIGVPAVIVSAEIMENEKKKDANS